jgi:hypothetical protein
MASPEGTFDEPAPASAAPVDALTLHGVGFGLDEIDADFQIRVVTTTRFASTLINHRGNTLQ